MKVFDFDNTLYHGESGIDFVLFLIKKNKRILLWVPRIARGLVQYKLCRISKEEIMRKVDDFMKVFVKDKKEVEGYVSEFWTKYDKFLKMELISQIEKDDAIISAGPSFLIEHIKDKLHTANLMCSEIDLETKTVKNMNFGENKVACYRQKYGNLPIDSFYTDSFNDRAMMDISNQVFLVKGYKIKQIK